MTDIANDLKCDAIDAVLAWHEHHMIPCILSQPPTPAMLTSSVDKQLALTTRHLRFLMKLDQNKRALHDPHLPRGVLWDEPNCDDSGVPVPGSVLCHLEDIKQVAV